MQLSSNNPSRWQWVKYEKGPGEHHNWRLEGAPMGEIVALSAIRTPADPDWASKSAPSGPVAGGYTTAGYMWSVVHNFKSLGPPQEERVVMVENGDITKALLKAQELASACLQEVIAGRPVAQRRPTAYDKAEDRRAEREAAAITTGRYILDSPTRSVGGVYVWQLSTPSGESQRITWGAPLPQLRVETTDGRELTSISIGENPLKTVSKADATRAIESRVENLNRGLAAVDGAEDARTFGADPAFAHFA